jgi:hypothetical protein
MKQVSVTIHPFSALVGMAVLSMVWVTAAAMPLQGSSSDRDVSAIEDVNDVHPRDFVNIRGDQPYVVPEGRLLVLTGGGKSNNTGSLVLHVDGLTEVYSTTWNTGTNYGLAICSIIEFPRPGLVVQAGKTVTLGWSPDSTLRAWGYLVDA